MTERINFQALLFLTPERAQVVIEGGFMGNCVFRRSQQPISPSGMRAEKVGLEFGPLRQNGRTAPSKCFSARERPQADF